MNPFEKSIADLDGDGVPDLIVAGAGGPAVWYHTPDWVKRTISSSASSQSGSATGDIDGDGDQDVVVGDTWYENVNHAASWITHALPNQGAGTHDVAIADVTGDGKMDVLVRGEVDNFVHLFAQVSPTNWTETWINPGAGLNGLDAADLNGDGRVDIVVGGGVWVENDAAQTWPVHVFGTWDDYAYVHAIDLDGDGRRDIVASISESAVGASKVSWFSAGADPLSPWVEHPIDSGLTAVHALVIADADLDGQLDVFASEYRDATGDTESGRLMYYRAGLGALAWTASQIANDGIHNVRGADLDGDGVVDLFGCGSGNWERGGTEPVYAYLSGGGSGSGSGGSGSAGMGSAGSGSSGMGGAVAGTGGGTGGSAAGAGGGSEGGASGGTAGSGGSSITIGETSILATDDYGNNGLIVAQQVSLSQAAMLQSLSFYVADAVGKLRLGLYDAAGSGGAPKNLKAAAAEIVAPVVGWNTASVTPAALPAGNYWLAYAPSSGALHFRVDSSGNARVAHKAYAALPATFPASSAMSAHWSFYGTLQP